MAHNAALPHGCGGTGGVPSPRRVGRSAARRRLREREATTLAETEAVRGAPLPQSHSGHVIAEDRTVLEEVSRTSADEQHIAVLGVEVDIASGRLLKFLLSPCIARTFGYSI